VLPSVVIMSQNPLEAASSPDYEVIFDNALNAYKTKTGKDLAKDPLLRRLESCNSPDSVLSLLRQQIPGFDHSESSDERLTKWVSPAVNVIYTFASTIGGAVSLVSFGKFHSRPAL
jgi:fungal STAND N-terminal Goodbye domain